MTCECLAGAEFFSNLCELLFDAFLLSFLVLAAADVGYEHLPQCTTEVKGSGRRAATRGRTCRPRIATSFAMVVQLRRARHKQSRQMHDAREISPSGNQFDKRLVTSMKRPEEDRRRAGTSRKRHLKKDRSHTTRLGTPAGHFRPPQSNENYPNPSQVTRGEIFSRKSENLGMGCRFVFFAFV